MNTISSKCGQKFRDFLAALFPRESSRSKKHDPHHIAEIILN